MSLSHSLKAKVLNTFTNSFLGKAGKLLGKRVKVMSFLAFVITRFSDTGAVRGTDNFKSFVRMLQASVRGTYPHLPWRTAVAVLGSLLYLASPIDVIPDFIPVLGFLDDAFLLSKIFSLAQDDLKNFIQWEEEQEVIGT